MPDIMVIHLDGGFKLYILKIQWDNHKEIKNKSGCFCFNLKTNFEYFFKIFEAQFELIYCCLYISTALQLRIIISLLVCFQ